MGKESLKSIDARLHGTHKFLAEGLLSPFYNQTNQSRGQMFTSHVGQAIQMRQSDTPRVFTGFENQVGKYSSGYRKIDGEWLVLQRFSKNKLNYVLIIQNTKTLEYDIIFRREVEHLTEIFGYELNNTELDSIDEGDIIKDHIVYHDNNYDSDMNLKYGKNLRVAYQAFSGFTNEDAVVMSESTAKSMASPFVEKVRVRVNTNDILLNLYENEEQRYKTFPDVGEMVRPDGILIGHRRISYDEIINKFQDRKLQEVTDTDSVKYVNSNSRVVDIDIWNNNDIESMKDEPYNSQVLHTYGSILHYYTKVVEFLEPIVTNKNKNISRDLRTYYNEVASFRDPISEFEEDGRRFDNLVIEFTISYLEPVNLGSKLTSRYGTY